MSDPDHGPHANPEATLIEECARLRGKIYALTTAGDAMDLLLTGSMKPSKGVREAWGAAKKLSA